MSSTAQNYSFRLTPYTAFVKGLANVNSNDFAISDESDSDIGCNDLHVLTSPHINSLTDEKEVTRKLKGLLMLINGALSISFGFEQFERFGPLGIDASEGISLSHVTNIESLDIEQSSPFASGVDMKLATNAQEYSKLVYVASQRYDVRVILGMCSMRHDWVNLYRLWDTLSHFISEEYSNDNAFIPDIKKTKPQTKDLVSALCGIPLADISAFTATANSFELLGLASRHGIGGTGSGGNPQKTMNRSEAMKFIWTICQRYLRRTRAL
ncbi:TPA: hypothetical protein QHU55_004680 [Klebsiella aerogenes]|nr:hypothetical protein [Klebsiella aerogenes]HDS6532733.1 hypothetical protein [Klebsiella aerogenes]HDS7502322.1 hypothetical protein [Klebsiella aerogenes]HDS9642413.1 hypothetical protein [Klebsiella aerogenes]HDT2317337.1 hypothetical protein [Klebsiella aerogenes]